LLRELNQIFFPKGRESRPALKKNCFCLKFDLIRKLHLPNVAACFGIKKLNFLLKELKNKI